MDIESMLVQCVVSVGKGKENTNNHNSKIFEERELFKKSMIEYYTMFSNIIFDDRFKPIF